jgi:uncharacterized protein YneF (UPF0154 family)
MNPYTNEVVTGIVALIIGLILGYLIPEIRKEWRMK